VIVYWFFKVFINNERGFIMMELLQAYEQASLFIRMAVIILLFFTIILVCSAVILGFLFYMYDRTFFGLHIYPRRFSKLVKKQVYNHCRKVVTDLKYFQVKNHTEYFIVQGVVELKGRKKQVLWLVDVVSKRVRWLMKEDILRLEDVYFDKQTPYTGRIVLEFYKNDNNTLVKKKFTPYFRSRIL